MHFSPDYNGYDYVNYIYYDTAPCFAYATNITMQECKYFTIALFYNQDKLFINSELEDLADNFVIYRMLIL